MPRYVIFDGIMVAVSALMVAFAPAHAAGLAWVCLGLALVMLAGDTVAHLQRRLARRARYRGIVRDRARRLQED